MALCCHEHPSHNNRMENVMRLYVSAYHKHNVSNNVGAGDLTCQHLQVSVSYFLPLAVIVVNYLNIGRFLWRVSRQVSGGNTSNVSKSKVAVVKMLALAATLFAVLWVPFFVLFTMEEIAGTDDSDSGGSTLDLVKQSMIILSTLTNPTVYALFNKRIRKGVVNMFRRCASSNSDITTTAMHNNPVVLDTN
ncbi:hypothetical protein LSAT2_028662 [Lamellibrachia satsuma]|nr:hypothetical protein LSAT2_028662 [Lamellibrachia satsuma]